MNPIKCVIIEDEKNGQQTLVELLKIVAPQIQILGITEDVNASLQLIQTTSPDLVFLDIQLGQESGFDLLKQLETIDFQVIFTTALSNFALRAFQANAVDYLLKPIAPEELQNAIQKAQKIIHADAFQQRFSNLMQTMEQKKIERIVLPSQADGLTILDFNDLLFVEGSGTYATFHTHQNEKIVAAKNLGHFAAILPPNLFFRTHQSYLVKLSAIRKVKPAEGIVELFSGQQIPLSRRRKDLLIAALQ